MLVNQFGNRIPAGGDDVNLGPEMVTNGGFDTDTDWTGTGTAYFTISGGLLNAHTTTGRRVYQAVGMSVNTQYRGTFEVSGYTEGELQFVYYGSTYVTIIPVTANGDYLADFTTGPTISLDRFGFQSVGTNTIMSIDNLSLKEIL